MAHPPQEQTPSKTSRPQNSEQQPQYPGAPGAPGAGHGASQGEGIDSEALLQGFPPRDGEDPVEQELLQRLGDEKREDSGGRSQSQQ